MERSNLKQTYIGLADSTWNPIRGCKHAGDDCQNCWAERIAGRYAKKGQTYYGIAKLVKGEPKWTGKVAQTDKRYEPLEWTVVSGTKTRSVLVGTMTDLFYDKIPDAWRDEVFGIIALCGNFIFQVQTKYVDAMREYFAAPDVFERIELNAREAYKRKYGRENPSKGHLEGPLANTWLGVSVSDQETADARIRTLQEIPAALYYAAVEPMLGPVTLKEYLTGRRPLKWVIAGGESGWEVRPMRPAWVRQLRDECIKAKRPFFFHQWGAWLPVTTDQLKNHAGPNSVAYIWPDGDMSVHLAKSNLRAMKEHGAEIDGKEWTDRPAWKNPVKSRSRKS